MSLSSAIHKLGHGSTAVGADEGLQNAPCSRIFAAWLTIADDHRRGAGCPLDSTGNILLSGPR